MSKKGFAKKVYKTLKIVLIVYWIIFAFIYIAGAYTRSYIYPIKYKEEIINSAKENQIDAFLIFAICKVESNFNKNAESKSGAKGIMQIQPETAKYIASLRRIESYNILDPQTNINFGTYYLRYLINKFIVIETAICAYNAGEGNVKAWLLDSKYTTDNITLISTPFAETNSYLIKIKNTQKTYIKYYKNQIKVE